MGRALKGLGTSYRDHRDLWQKLNYDVGAVVPGSPYAGPGSSRRLRGAFFISQRPYSEPVDLGRSTPDISDSGFFLY